MILGQHSVTILVAEFKLNEVENVPVIPNVVAAESIPAVAMEKNELI